MQCAAEYRTCNVLLDIERACAAEYRTRNVLLNMERAKNMRKNRQVGLVNLTNLAPGFNLVQIQYHIYYDIILYNYNQLVFAI